METKFETCKVMPDPQKELNRIREHSGLEGGFNSWGEAVYDAEDDEELSGLPSPVLVMKFKGVKK